MEEQVEIREWSSENIACYEEVKGDERKKERKEGKTRNKKNKYIKFNKS